MLGTQGVEALIPTLSVPALFALHLQIEEECLTHRSKPGGTLRVELVSGFEWLDTLALIEERLEEV